MDDIIQFFKPIAFCCQPQSAKATVKLAKQGSVTDNSKFRGFQTHTRQTYGDDRSEQVSIRPLCSETTDHMQI
jgi:hypothetical protein